MTTCALCGRALHDDRSIAVRLGRACAARRGVAWGGTPLRKARRDRGVKRGPRRRETAQQALPFAPVETPWEAEGFSAAQWPEVVRMRALSAGDPRHVEGCPGCEWFGLCALHVAEDRPWAGYVKRRVAVQVSGNSNAPAGEIAEASCPQP